MKSQRIEEIGTHGADDRNWRDLCCCQQQVDEPLDISGVLHGSILVTTGLYLSVEFLPLVDIQQQPVRLAFRLIQLFADHVRQQLEVTRP